MSWLLQRLPVVPLLVLLGVWWVVLPWEPRARYDNWALAVGFAWVAQLVAVAGALSREDLRRPELALRPRDGVGLGLMVAWGVGAVSFLRSRQGVTTNEIWWFPDPGLPWTKQYLMDMGLPSLTHNLLIAPARWGGGVGLVTGVHLVAYAGILLALLVLLRRVTHPDVALGVTALVAVQESFVFQVTELRAYATYLLLVTLASVAMVPARDRDDTGREGWVVVALGLAAMDSPAVITVLAGWCLGLAWRERRLPLGAILLGGLRGGDPSVRRWRASVMIALGMLPMILVVRSVHPAQGAPFLWLRSPVAWLDVGLLGAGLLSVLGLRRWRPGAVAGLVGYAAVLVLVASGSLRDEPKYLLFLAPLGLAAALETATALLGRRLSTGATTWTLLVAALALDLANRALLASAPYPLDVEAVTNAARLGWWLPVVVVVAGAVARLVRGRGAAVRTLAVSSVLVFGAWELVWESMRWWGMGEEFGRYTERGAVVDAHLDAAGDPDLVACSSASVLSFGARAVRLHRERSGPWDSLERPAGAIDPKVRYPVPCPGDVPFLRFELLERGEEAPDLSPCTPDAVLSLQQGWSMHLWRCPAGTEVPQGRDP